MESFLKNNNGFVLEVLKNKEQKSSKSKVCFFDLGSGEIRDLPLYGHMQEVEKNFPWVREELEALSEKLSEEEQEFADSIPEGEHPGWHVFECYAYGEKADKDREIFKRLAKEHRWYRVGFYKSKMDLNPVKEKELNETDSKFFANFASEFDFKLEFEKEKY